MKRGSIINRDSINWWGINNRKWNLLVDQIASTESDLSNYIDDIRKLSRHTDMAAVEWILSMREGLRMIDKYPNDICRVKFEQLTLKPRETLEEIIEFCELPADSKFFEYACSVLSPLALRGTVELHHVVKNPFYQTMRALEYE